MKLNSLDSPPHSRIFILHSKDISEDLLKNKFSKFGNVENIWGIIDKHTGENKGITYIKYSKFSEAAEAVEEMNGVCVDEKNRPLKVIIASSREDGKSEFDRVNFLRLFICVEKDETVNKQEITDYFGQFGEVNNVTILKDRTTNKSKGFAYVQYLRMDAAARALEQCDPKFKAVIARPKEKTDNINSERYFKDNLKCPLGPNINEMISGNRNNISERNGTSVTARISAFISSQVTEEQAVRLFDLTPGFKHAEFANKVSNNTNRIILEYNSAENASYALLKFNGFEYPLGELIKLKQEKNYNWMRDSVLLNNSCKEVVTSATPNKILKKKLVSITNVLANATAVIRRSANITDNLSFDAVSKSSALIENGQFRLFFVCKPTSLPISVLRDIFSRFGNMLTCYLLPNRNCGYVQYYTQESADNAKKGVNDQQLKGITINVVDADPPVSGKYIRAS